MLLIIPYNYNLVYKVCSRSFVMGFFLNCNYRAAANIPCDMCEVLDSLEVEFL